MLLEKHTWCFACGEDGFHRETELFLGLEGYEIFVDTCPKCGSRKRILVGKNFPENCKGLISYEHAVN